MLGLSQSLLLSHGDERVELTVETSDAIEKVPSELGGRETLAQQSLSESRQRVVVHHQPEIVR
jgi:hypothetical protein